MSVYDYMMRFLKNDSASGDLARDMEHLYTRLDDLEVHGIDSLEGLLTYLHFKHACKECIATAKSCWRNYVRYISSHV